MTGRSKAARVRLLERAAAGLTNEQLEVMDFGALARLVALGTVAQRVHMLLGFPPIRTELRELLRACEQAGCFCPEQRMDQPGFRDAWVELLDAAKAAVPFLTEDVYSASDAAAATSRLSNALARLDHPRP